MSTFDGIINEFPDIRIDYFRRQPGKNPPQACFLSHIHSDHLQGLETLKMPFVYCSAATKRILLQMEKYPHRINFAKGILEARKQTYKHLKSVLRPLPIETPVELELGPKSRIRVTLFDANHCPGAVMFLMEGNDNAILYTGDVRAEPWWVNSITRNPVLLPYSCGMKKLDCVYLDTTFASHDEIYQEFPTKAEGIKELLSKIEKCPRNSIYYFRAWTLGYEDVWIALATFLKTSIHVDDYQLRIFRSLSDSETQADRGACLAGFVFGNQHQLGYLTDIKTASVHSCEPGTECHDRLKKQKNVVWISPIISRLKDGTEVAELGAGGGGGDLHPAVQLEMIDEAALQALENLCVGSMDHKKALIHLGAAFAEARGKGEHSISIDDIGLDKIEELTLKDFVRRISSDKEQSNQDFKPPEDSHRVIHIPYSRHSSYSELRHLISSLRPTDICPCTVDIENWSEDISMRSLFGDICSGEIFRYDEEARAKLKERRISQKATKSNKRKRGDGVRASQSSSVPKSQSTEEVFKSARTSLREDKGEDPHSHNGKENSVITIPSQVRRIHEALAERFDQDLLAAEQGRERTRSPESTHQDVEELFNSQRTTSSSPLSLSPLAFRPEDSESPSQLTSDVTRRQRNRKRAYHAATTALALADYTAWHNLRLRSTGWKGHTELETLL